MKRVQPDLAMSRRDLLRLGGGFGMIGLAAALDGASLLAHADGPAGVHFPPRAKRVIHLFMNGGPSHVDTFDPKPALAKHEGDVPTNVAGGRKVTAGYQPSPFKFAPHGDSGVVMSELFPRLARCADDLCVVRSMHTDVPNHEPALLVMNSGNQQPIRPSLGSWLSYGLGTLNQNLPPFVVLSPGLPVVGPQLWSSSFLPGEHQGMSVDSNDLAVEKMVANLNHPTLTRARQREQLDLLASLNSLHASARQADGPLRTHIRAMETAFQMQREAADAFDVARETDAVRDAYGPTPFGQSCLLARRLVERGVRMVQVHYVSKGNKQPWDTHSNNDDAHRKLCDDSDRGTAALLTDLKQRGMLEDTLVIWGGEFGRTPYAQKQKDGKGKPGRDHHHTGFSTVLAGGGVRGGNIVGATDEFGMVAVENRVHVHDLHATVLHLLGLDHERLTFRYAGRDFRLTDVHGRVVSEILS